MLINYLSYWEALKLELNVNKKYASLVNSVFFPSRLNIFDWISQLEIESLTKYRPTKESYPDRICTRQEIDNIPFYTWNETFLTRYSIFEGKEFASYEDILKNYSREYYIIQKDFVRILDNCLLKKLGDFSYTTDSNRWMKKVSKNISIELHINRDLNSINSLAEYSLPPFSINFNGVNLNLGCIDARQFLFLPESSFLFFYFDMNHYTIEPKVGVQGIQPKNDEPVVYSLHEQKGYLLTNTWLNIEKYNKYIEIVFEITAYYYRFFEQWLVASVSEQGNIQELSTKEPPDIRN